MIKYLILLATTLFFVACSKPVTSNITPKPTEAPKYQINNSSTLAITYHDYEKLYEKSKNASIAWIDTIKESEYLEPEKCSLTVLPDKSASFILKTIDKPDIKDDSVLVTFKYQDDDTWKRIDIMYNGKKAGE